MQCTIDAKCQLATAISIATPMRHTIGSIRSRSRAR